MGGSGVLQLLLAPSMCQALSTAGLQPPAQLDLAEITFLGETWQEPGDSHLGAMGVQRKPRTQPGVGEGFPEQMWAVLRP